jgi:hypothetical protein
MPKKSPRYKGSKKANAGIAYSLLRTQIQQFILEFADDDNDKAHACYEACCEAIAAYNRKLDPNKADLYAIDTPELCRLCATLLANLVHCYGEAGGLVEPDED